MTDPKRTRRGWLKIGCAVLAGVGGFVLLATVFLFGSAVINSRLERVERRTLQHAIGPSAETAPLAPGTALPPQAAGRVVLDFTVGHFSVEPGALGEPIRVEAEYDTRSYALEESFEPSTGTGWSYRATFGEVGVLRDGGLRGLLGGAYPRIRVHLPPGVPFALEGRFGRGVSELKLGGLWLTRIDLDVEKGDFRLSINEPLAAPVDAVRIRSSQGSLRARLLGNASPETLEIGSSMGGATIDLRGRWLNDADVRIRSSMGGADVILPRDVRVEGLGAEGRLVAPRSTEVPPPTLRVSVRRFLGGLSVSD